MQLWYCVGSRVIRRVQEFINHSSPSLSVFEVPWTYHISPAPLPSFLPSFPPYSFERSNVRAFYKRSNYHLESYWSTSGHRAVDWSTEQCSGSWENRTLLVVAAVSAAPSSVIIDRTIERAVCRQHLDSVLCPWLEQLVQYDSWEEYHSGCLEHSIRCLPHPGVAVPTVRSNGWERFVDYEHSTVHRVGIWWISATIPI